MKRKGLLAYPLRKVVRKWWTQGGNPNTNPARYVLTLDCGHKVELIGLHHGDRKFCRCDECPALGGEGKPLIEIL